MEIVQQLLTLLAPVLAAYAGDHGVVVQVLSIIGTLRLFFKPIMAAIEVAVAQSESKKDDEVLAKVQGNKIYSLVLFLIDLLASIKPVKKPVPVAVAVKK
jgi:DMSO reductase anchor subunit